MPVVYFLRAGDEPPVKIGYTSQLAPRATTLQNMCWLELKIIRVMRGGRLLEQWLHNHYADRRIRGEWFRFCPTMLTIQPRLVAREPGGLLAEIDAFLIEQGITARELGAAVGYHGIVSILRHGKRAVGQKHIERLRAYMAERSPSQASAA